MMFRRDGNEHRRAGQYQIWKSAKANSSVCSGPSGCGKSTTAEHHRRFHRADERRGRASTAKPVRGPDPRRIFVFQERGVFPWLTVEGNIGFGLFKLLARKSASSASRITSSWSACRASRRPTRRSFPAA